MTQSLCPGMSEELQLLAAIVKQAGENLLAIRQDTIVTDEKDSPRNTVTQYDRATQEFLEQNLLQAFDGRPDPDTGAPLTCRFLSEEDAEASDDRHIPFCDEASEPIPAAFADGWLFVIDPIDGTANFRYGTRYSAVSVALLCGGKPYAGVVYNPYADELFYAQTGKGAFVTVGGTARPIRVSGNRLLERHGMVGFGTSPYREKLQQQTFRFLSFAAPEINDIRRSGTASLDLCSLACGRLDVFFELSLYPWDYAAGVIICTEAGAAMTTMDGAPLTFAHRGSLAGGNPTAHGELLVLYRRFQQSI